MTIYYQPSDLDLDAVGEVEWDDESYQFNLTGVWRHTVTGDLYYADDSGCSCPSPFEDCRTLQDFTRVEKMQDLIEHLADQQGGRTDVEVTRQVASLVRASIEAHGKIG